MRQFFCAAMVMAVCAAAFGQATTRPADAGMQGRDPNTGLAFNVKPVEGTPPKEWVDKDTGHRVVRLSDEPGSLSMYFHQYSFTKDAAGSEKLVFTSPTGIYWVDLATKKIEKLLPDHSVVDGKTVSNNVIQVGRKTGRIFLTRTEVRGSAGAAGGYAVSADRAGAERTVWWFDPRTKEEHKIGVEPENYNVSTVNADETMLAGAVLYLDGRGGAATQPVRAAPGQRINLGARWAQHLPMALITMDAETGKINAFNPSNDWDNHFQFSPTDPKVLMYCHEGPWQNNDRVWVINTDGTGLFKVHTRTMINEIWGHEFWGPDGKTSWYQLNYPRGAGSTSWIAGTNLQTHQQTWYHLADGDTSIHVNISPDGTMFAGDGNNGNKWIVLQRPTLSRNMAAGVYDTSGLIRPGTIATERLVNMKDQQYALEPNPMFTPDNKWVVFRSNMFGPSYVFEVEVAKAQ